jgi:hypothetical protein
LVQVEKEVEVGGGGGVFCCVLFLRKWFFMMGIYGYIKVIYGETILKVRYGGQNDHFGGGSVRGAKQ